MKILVHRHSGGLGDVLCLLPAVRALRARHPAAQIDLALPEPYAGLLRGRLGRVGVLAADYRSFRPRGRKLLESRYDVLYDLAGPAPGDPEPNRIEGFAARCRVPLGDPVPRLPLTDAEIEAGCAWMAANGLAPDRPVVALHLRSAKAAKDWPLESMRELARQLLRHGVRVVGLERELRLAVPGAVEAVGWPLASVAALLAGCDLLVGPDSGPMHLAAAVGTPCVALFGPTDPRVILKHYGRTHLWLWADDLSRLPVDQVLARVLDRLWPGRPPSAAMKRAGLATCSEPARPKVLFVAEQTYPGTLRGAEVSMHLLADQMRKSGFDTEVYAGHRGATREMAAAMQAADPDWVFTQLRAAPEAVRLAKDQGRRTAVCVRSLGEHVCGYQQDGLQICAETGGRADPATCSLGCVRKRADLARQRAMFAAADLTVCNSGYVRGVIERFFPEARTVVQYPTVVPPRRIRRRRRRYLTVVRPMPGKGKALFEELVRRLPEQAFLVVGSVGALEVPWERVAHLPIALHPDEIYRPTRILLQPAVNVEAFGRTVAEAGAYRVPSVVSRQGGLPEALGAGGLAVTDFQNPDAWLDAIARVEADYDAFAIRAREHARRFRTIEPLLRAMDEVVRRVPALGARAARRVA